MFSRIEMVLFALVIAYTMMWISMRHKWFSTYLELMRRDL